MFTPNKSPASDLLFPSRWTFIQAREKHDGGAFELCSHSETIFA